MPATDIAERFGSGWPKDANGAPPLSPDRSIATRSDVAHKEPKTWFENVMSQYHDSFVPADPEHDDALVERRQQGLTFDGERLQQHAQTTPFDQSRAELIHDGSSRREGEGLYRLDHKDP